MDGVSTLDTFLKKIYNVIATSLNVSQLLARKCLPRHFINESAVRFT